MKYSILPFLFVLATLFAQAQNNNNYQPELLQTLFQKELVAEKLEEIADQSTYSLSLDEGTVLYQTDEANASEFNHTVEVLKFKNYGQGRYKVKCAIEGVRITSKVWYDVHTQQMTIKKLYIRDANWLFGKGDFHYWEVHT